MDSTFNERPQMQCRLNLWLSEDLCFFCWTPTAWLSVATKVGVLKQLFIWVEPASVLANPFWSVNYWVSHNRTAKAATQMQNEHHKCKMNNWNAKWTTQMQMPQQNGGEHQPMLKRSHWFHSYAFLKTSHLCIQRTLWNRILPFVWQEYQTCTLLISLAQVR